MIVNQVTDNATIFPVFHFLHGVQEAFRSIRSDKCQQFPFIGQVEGVKPQQFTGTLDIIPYRQCCLPDTNADA